MNSLLLIHGGLWDDMNAQRFWAESGVVTLLESRGHAVHAPDRLRHARNWISEADYLAAMLPATPMVVVAASNGCSAAVRLALQRPERVKRLVLCWPATAGDAQVDESVRERMRAAGADKLTIDALLNGASLRGVSDAELKRLALDVGVLPAPSEHRFHQRRTTDRLLQLLPRGIELAASPGYWDPEFGARLPDYVATLESFMDR